MLTKIGKWSVAGVPFALSVAGILGAVACGGVPTEGEEAVGQVENAIVIGTGAYTLVGLQSGKCAQIQGGSTASTARLEIATCDGSAKQQFLPESMGSGFYRLRNVNSNLCVDVSGASTANGAAVIQFACGTGLNQQWSFTDVTGGERVTARHSGKVLDVVAGGTANGTLLNQWSSNGGTNQVFKLNPAGPYAPRSGTFKMLVYSKTQGYRHPSMAAGVSFFQTMGAEKGFSVVATETNENFTSSALAGFEIVVFMNTTGDVLTDTEQTAFQNWMTTKNGAWLGVHSAADTESEWAWYHELTGQFYSGHSVGGVTNTIAFDAKYATHPVLKGVPSPWTLQEEWFNFSAYASWQDKPGFQILGRKTSDNQPIIWARQNENYRSFYSGLGHDPGVAFSNPDVKKLLTNAVFWAVRREQLL
jgi:type 1 glutamine amidotransferase